MLPHSGGGSSMDRLSDLPDELLIAILSWLPTRAAARTSVLSRRFRHLWEASPCVVLSTEHISSFKPATFAAMAKSALLSRNNSDPLLHLGLVVDPPYISDLTFPFFSSLLVKAHSLGLRHLAFCACCNLEPILPSVFSISSLETLNLPTFTRLTFPSPVTLTRLKSLDFKLYNGNSTEVNLLLSQLPSLEDLYLGLVSTQVFSLSSRTIRKLVLHIIDLNVELHIPTTEFVAYLSLHWRHFVWKPWETVEFCLALKEIFLC